MNAIKQTNDFMDKEQTDREREEIIYRIDETLDAPLIFLSIVWLILIILDLTYGLPPFLQALSNIIWIIFIVDFLIELYIAPKRETYIRKNWLVALSLLLPPLRIFRVFRPLKTIRLLRFGQSFRLASIISSFNRSLRVVRNTMKKRGLGYVLALTALVTLIGAAGMYNFEYPNFNSYGDALWWTGMIMTTIGSQYWPATTEGRILAFLLSVYALAILGYVAAALASVLIGKDQETKSKEIEELREEIHVLSMKVNEFMNKEK